MSTVISVITSDGYECVPGERVCTELQGLVSPALFYYLTSPRVDFSVIFFTTRGFRSRSGSFGGPVQTSADRRDAGIATRDRIWFFCKINVCFGM